MRIKAVSSLSGAIMVMGALLSACSLWGGNPPPRYNTVIGDKRVPALNPGGNKIVRPADSILPASPQQLKPQSQRVMPQSFQSSMEDSSVMQVQPVASAAAAPVEPMSVPADLPSPAPASAAQANVNPAQQAQPTPAQLAATAPAAGGMMVSGAAVASGDMQQQLQEAKGDMATMSAPVPAAPTLESQAQQAFTQAEAPKPVPLPNAGVKPVAISATPVQSAPVAVEQSSAVNVLSGASKGLDAASLRSEEIVPAAPSAPAAANVASSDAIKDSGWKTVSPLTVAPAAEKQVVRMPIAAPAATASQAAMQPEKIEAPKVAVAPAPAPAPVAVAAKEEVIAPPVFTRAADGKWEQHADTTPEAVERAPLNSTLAAAPAVAAPASTEVAEAPSVNVGSDMQQPSVSSVASTTTSSMQGNYLPPSRYARYRSGYQSYRLSRLSGEVSN